MAEILEQIDATVDGRCPCGADPRPGSAYCSADCEPTHRGPDTDAPWSGPRTAARWRPDLVTAFDDTGLTLLDSTRRDDTGLDYRIYTDPGSDLAFLRVDDGHRFVGLHMPWSELEASGPSEPFRRLERELSDRRRLGPEPGHAEPAPIMRVGDRVYWETDRPALIAWLCANGLVPADVPAGQTVTIDGDTVTLDCFARDQDGHIRLDDSREDFLVRRVSVPLVQPPPVPVAEPEPDGLRCPCGCGGPALSAAEVTAALREGCLMAALSADDQRAVLSGRPDQRAQGTVFWLPDRPADPEAPTVAELAGGVDLTPYRAPADTWSYFTWVDETHHMDLAALPRALEPREQLREGDRILLHWSAAGSDENEVTELRVAELRPDGSVETEPAARDGDVERFRQLGEQVTDPHGYGLASFGEFGVELYQQAVAGAVQAESDRVALRAVCTDEAMYERALAAARERGWSVPQMMAAVAVGRYTEEGWSDDPAC